MKTINIQKWLVTFVAIIIVGLHLTGCDNKITKCPTIDWASFGYDDGKVGFDRQGGIARHEKTCGVNANSSEIHGYSIGWEAGIVQFCEPVHSKSNDKKFAVCKGQPGF